MSKNSRMVLVILFAIILIVFLLSKKSDDRVVKIGVLAPLSGIAADYGEQVRLGIESVKVPENIKIIFEDEQCDTKFAVSAYKKLIDLDKVDYLIGPVCGSPQEAVSPLIKDSKILTLLPSAASKTMYEISGGNVLNVQYSLEDEAKFIAEKMYAKGYKNVAVISYQNEFSKVERDSFVANFPGTIKAEIVYALNDSDIQTELTKIKGGGFDAIFSTDISFYFGGGLQKLKNLGIDVPIFTPYPAELPVAREFVEGVLYSFPTDINDGQGGIYGLSKESIEILVNAIKSCGRDKPCVRKTVTENGFDDFGVKQRSLVLKQIKNKEAIVVE